VVTARQAVRSVLFPWPVGVLRLVVLLLLVGQLFVTAVVQRPDLLHPSAVGSDPSNYFAAALRLNAGHSLYGALQPGDRPVPGYPGTLPAPILSPPLIALVWRPLALLPGAWSMDLWWLGCLLLLVALVVAFAAVAKPPKLAVLAAVLALGLPLAFIGTGHYPYLGYNSPVSFAALSGNVNSYLVGLFVLTWWASSSGRPWLAGSAAALATALKLGPVVLLWWFITQHSWRSARAFVVAGVAFAVVGLVFAGLQANIDFVHLALGGDVKPTAWSVTGMLHRLLKVPSGIARYGTMGAIVAGLTAVLALRNHPRAAFTAAILTTIYSSPVVLQGNLALLVVIAAPWAPPPPKGSSESARAGDRRSLRPAPAMRA
jgi:hypothetical protein